MGVTSINYLPPAVTKKQVLDFLKVLGFKVIYKTHFQHHDENNLERITPVVADITKHGSDSLQVELTTTIWRSVYDHDIHNFAIKQIKLRFGGSFITPSGRNRYLVYDDCERRKAEAACYLAYFHFSNNLSRINYYLQTLKTHFADFKIRKDDFFHPASTHTTIGLPFLISIIEDYLRSTYIGLLTYCEKKKDIFKSAKISTEALYEVTINETTIEKVIAHSKSFQSVTHINQSFKELDSKINFIDLLNRNNPKAKYLEKLTEIISLRHKIIHEAIKIENYVPDHFQYHIELITDIVEIFYSHLRKIYNWQDVDL